MTIMSQLPNDIIMRIVRQADGGIYTHKHKYSNVMGELNNIIEGNECGEIYEDIDAGGLSTNEIWAGRLNGPRVKGVMFEGNSYEVAVEEGHEDYVSASLYVDRISRCYW